MQHVKQMIVKIEYFMQIDKYRECHGSDTQVFLKSESIKLWYFFDVFSSL